MDGRLKGGPSAQTSDIEAESRSASAALGLALAENFHSSSLGATDGSYNMTSGSDGVRSLSLSSTGTAQYLGLVRPESLEVYDRRAASLPSRLISVKLPGCFLYCLPSGAERPCASGVQGAMDSLQPNTPIATQSNLSFSGVALGSI